MVSVARSESSRRGSGAKNNCQQTLQHARARRGVWAQPGLIPSGGQYTVLKSVLQEKCQMRGVFRRRLAAKERESSLR